MVKKIVFAIMFLVTFMATKSYAVSPTGQGIFIVNNCSSIVSPVTNGTYCLVGTTMSVWNGSAYTPITGGGGGGPINTLPSQTGAYSAQGFRMENFGTGTTSGDAMAFGLNHINDMATATGNYNMGGNKIQGQAAGTTSGDTLVFALNHVNDMAAATAAYSMGGNKLQSLAVGTISGDALVYALSHLNDMATATGPYNMGGNLINAVAYTGQATLRSSINFNTFGSTGTFYPALKSSQIGDVWIVPVAFGAQSSGAAITFTPPSGFTMIPGCTATDTGNNITVAVAYHVVTGGETEAYTFSNGSHSGTWGGSVQDWYGVNTSTIYDVCNATSTTAASSYAIPAITTTANNETVEVFAAQSVFANGTGTGPSTSATSTPIFLSIWSSVSAWYYPQVTAGSTGTFTVTNSNAVWGAIQLAFKNTTTMPSGAAVASGNSIVTSKVNANEVSGNINGSNVVTWSGWAGGADPTNALNSSPAIQAAYNDACLRANNTSGNPAAVQRVHIPSGVYALQSTSTTFGTLLFTCASNGTLQVDGDGPNASVLVAGDNFPAIMEYSSSAYTTIGAMTTSPLYSGGGAGATSMNWATTIGTYYYSLSALMVKKWGVKPLNGLTTLGIRFYINTPIADSNEHDIINSLSDGPGGTGQGIGAVLNNQALKVSFTSTTISAGVHTGATGVVTNNSYFQHVATNTLTANTTEEVEIDLDSGGYLTVYVAGVPGTPVLLTGNIGQLANELMTLGATFNSISGPSNYMQGQIFSFDMDKTAFHSCPSGVCSSFSPPTAPFTTNGNNTLVLLNGTYPDGTGTFSAPLMPVTSDGGAGSTRAAMGAMSEAGGQGDPTYMRNFGIDGGQVGIIDILTPDPMFKDLNITGTQFAGIWLENNSYNGTADDIAMSTTVDYGYRESYASFTETHRMHFVACGAFCYLGAGINASGMEVDPSSNTIQAITLIGGGILNSHIIALEFDSENGYANSDIYIMSGGTVEILGSTIGSATNVPVIQVDMAANASLAINTDAVEWQLSGGTAAIIDFGNLSQASGNSGGVSVVANGGSYNGGNLPTSSLLCGSNASYCTITGGLGNATLAGVQKSFILETGHPAFMCPVYTAGSASMTFVKPSCSLPGNVEVMFFQLLGTSIPTATGWTSAGACRETADTNYQVCPYWRIAPVSEGNITVSSSSGAQNAVVVGVMSGVDPINPIDTVTSTATNYGAIPQSAVVGTLTPNTANNGNDYVLSAGMFSQQFLTNATTSGQPSTALIYNSFPSGRGGLGGNFLIDSWDHAGTTVPSITFASGSSLSNGTASSAVIGYTLAFNPACNTGQCPVVGQNPTDLGITNSVQVGTPTGGSEGVGTINVAGGYYVNGTLLSGGGSVTGVTGSYPILSSGGAAPNISYATVTGFAANQTGADVGAKINACVTAVLAANSLGGTCDATNLTGTISTTVVVKPGVVLNLGPGTYTCSTTTSDCIQFNEGSHLEGVGWWVSGGTHIVSGTSTGILVHGVSSTGTSNWIHWSDAGGFSINGGGLDTNGIQIDRCGESAKLHDIYSDDNGANGIEYVNSQAGCAGGYNLEAANNLGAGVFFQGTSSKLAFYGLTGDSNVNGIIDISSSTNDISFFGLKSESIASSTNDPVIQVNNSNGQELNLLVSGGHFSGQQTAGSCVGVNGSNAWAQVSCNLIKLNGGQTNLDLENVDGTGFQNLLTDTAVASATVPWQALTSGKYLYNSGRGANIVALGGHTGGNNAESGAVFLDQAEMTNGFYGTTNVNQVPTPTVAPTLSGPGSTGGSTSGTWYCMSEDASGVDTPAGPAVTSSTINGALTQTNYVQVSCPRSVGEAYSLLIRGAYTSTGALIQKVHAATMQYGNDTNVEMWDYGQTAINATYPIPTTNLTGGMSLGGQFNAHTIEGVQYADQYLVVGSDPGAAINSCIAAVQARNAVGGICDAGGFSNNPTILTAITVPDGVTLRLGNGTYNCNVGSSDCITVNQGARLIGIGHTNSSFGTYIKANAAMTGNLVHVINSGGSSTAVQYAEVSNVTLNGTSAVPTDLLIDKCGDGTVIRDLYATASAGPGIQYNNASFGCAGFNNVNVPSNATYGIEFNATSDQITGQNISADNNTTAAIGLVNVNSGEIVLDGLKGQITSTSTSDPFISITGSTGQQPLLALRNVHVTGLSSGGSCTGLNSSAVPSSITCDFIKISAGQPKIELQNVRPIGFAHIINDVTFSKLITPDQVQGVHFTYSSAEGADQVNLASGNASPSVNSGLSVFDHIGIQNGLFSVLNVQALATPGAPTLSGPGSTGGSTSLSYYCVANAADGSASAASSATTITTALSTLTTSNYIEIACPRVVGAWRYDFLKTNTSTLLASTYTGQLSTGNDLNVEAYDYGQSTSAYTIGGATGQIEINGTNIFGSPVTDGVPYYNSNGLLTSTAAMTNGQLLIGSTSAAPQLATLTQGTGITITNAAHSITIAASAVGIQSQNYTNTTLNSNVTPITAATFTTILSVSPTLPTTGTTWVANFAYNVNAEQIATTATQGLVCYVTDGTNIFDNNQVSWASSSGNTGGDAFTGPSVAIGGSLVTYAASGTPTFTLKCANTGSDTWTAESTSGVTGGQKTSLTIWFTQAS